MHHVYAVSRKAFSSFLASSSRSTYCHNIVNLISPFFRHAQVEASTISVDKTHNFKNRPVHSFAFFKPSFDMNIVRTRLLIISDTHGMDFSPTERPLQAVDVAIHCGDLTDESKLKEFRTAIQLLKNIQAPLKLAIAGNHDFTMDIPAFNRIVANSWPPLKPDLVLKEFGTLGKAKELFEAAQADGIFLLDKGNHSFTLANGAQLTVYASPYTSSGGEWGFQYSRHEGHNFAINKNIDVAITHGPPKGIVDYMNRRNGAGCHSLFKAIAQARPRIHCFGHVHKGWGAKFVTWRNLHNGDDTDEEGLSTQPLNHFTAIDNERSVLLESLSGLSSSKFDSEDDLRRKSEKVKRYNQDRCCRTSHCENDEYPLERGKQTLFVNAAHCGDAINPVKNPWLVEIELPRAGTS